ncbi:MAG TPA: DUF4019 domain-containing protein [Rhizomicrobium sp.]|jgi:hypothetical protein|nr:DUF4019 domain-containing protein [Rhizomicrobium sp.]
MARREHRMKFLLVAFALILATPVLAQTVAGPSTAMTPTPDDRAKQWLTLIDDQNYADAFKQMGATARDKVSEQDFAAKIGATRTPMGAMSSRTLKDVNVTKTLPGMRDGQYTIVRYDSAFAHKAAAVESVTLESEKGAWSVVGYHIN